MAAMVSPAAQLKRPISRISEMRYLLTAVDSAKRVIALEVDGADETEAREVARSRGYAVIAVRRQNLLALERLQHKFPSTLFSIELLALLEAGLNVVEGLQALSEKESKPGHRNVLIGILACLHRGESLSQALQSYPQHFSPLYVATIRSSERTGDVREALGRYLAYQERFDDVRKKITAALLYPSILIVVGSLVLAFLLLYVIPRFASIYEEAAIDLPFFSAALLVVGRWFGENGVAAALLAATSLGGVIYAMTRPATRAAVVDRLYRFPFLGERMRVYQLGRFYRTAAMLLKAGIPLVKALGMVSSLLPSHMQGRLSVALAMLNEGKKASSALTNAGLATALATRMLTVGERSGSIGEMMDRIAKFCDDETARFIDAFSRVFEPLLMAGLGLAVGAVVVLMYMPVFELAGVMR